MNKILLTVVAVIAAVVVGYIVYMSYFSARVNIGKDVNAAGSENQNQPMVMPTTEKQKISVLDSLTPQANATTSTASVSAKEQILNSAAKPSGNRTVPASDAAKIKLLESLKK